MTTSTSLALTTAPTLAPTLAPALALTPAPEAQATPAPKPTATTFPAIPMPVPSLTQVSTIGATRPAPTVPAHVLPHRSPTELLAISRQGLAEAMRTRSDGLRYATAHLAALRAAAAVLAARARPEPRRRNRLTSVWVLLATVAPELGEWAAFFAAGAGKRAAAEAGIPRAVTTREADDLVRAADLFVEVAANSLGLAYQPAFEGLAS